MLNTIFIFLGIIAILSESLMVFLWIGASRYKYHQEKSTVYTPRTSIIVPCKGIHSKFKENIKAFCQQDYKRYNIIFILDSTEDPAYKLIKDTIGNDPKVSIEISNLIKGCSGKISALITGVKAAGDTEVYVFADSDIKPHKKWLKYLVSSLDEENIGATTGYRWYFPHNLKSALISAWNLASILPFFYGKLNYAWGGSTGIRRTTFLKSKIEEKWRTGFSDDLLLTEAVKDHGYTIKFIPKCVVESFSDEDIYDFIRWGSRQFTWVKWYFPPTWVISFIRMVGVKFLTMFGIFLIFTGFILPGILMMSTILIAIIYGWIGISTMKKNMCYSKKMMGSTATYALMMPVVTFINAYNYLSSLFMREVRWGGRIYRKSDVIRKK